MVAAEVIGVTDRALRDMTSAPRNRDKTYNLKKLVAWRQQELQMQWASRAGQAIGEGEEKSLERFRAANAEWREMDLAERRKLLVSVAAVRSEILRAMETLRETLLRLHVVLSPRLEGQPLPKISALIEAETRGMLDTLARQFRGRLAEAPEEEETAAGTGTDG